jgi:hypothetical protein
MLPTRAPHSGVSRVRECRRAIQIGSSITIMRLFRMTVSRSKLKAEESEISLCNLHLDAEPSRIRMPTRTLPSSGSRESETPVRSRR